MTPSITGRTIRFWMVAIVLLLALGFALQHSLLKGAKVPEWESPILSASISAPVAKVPVRPIAARVISPNLHPSNSPKSDPSSELHPSVPNPSGPESTDRKLVTPDPNGGNQTRDVVASDTSVIGVPFSVSASVEEMCKRDDIICPEVYKELTKLAQEPRDNEWAARTEANIQGQIESQGPNKYSIRNIECRTSVCAVEVSSIFGPYFGLGYYYDVKYSLMQGLGTIGAYERDPTGARITVTLMTFTRHQHLCPIKPCDLSSMSPP